MSSCGHCGGSADTCVKHGCIHRPDPDDDACTVCCWPFAEHNAITRQCPNYGFSNPDWLDTTYKHKIVDIESPHSTAGFTEAEAWWASCFPQHTQRKPDE